MFQLGNTLGYYFNDIACADISGAHFVAVHKTFKMTQPELLVTNTPDLPPLVQSASGDAAKSSSGLFVFFCVSSFNSEAKDDESGV